MRQAAGFSRLCALPDLGIAGRRASIFRTSAGVVRICAPVVLSPCSASMNRRSPSVKRVKHASKKHSFCVFRQYLQWTPGWPARAGRPPPIAEWPSCPCPSSLATTKRGLIDTNMPVNAPPYGAHQEGLAGDDCVTCMLISLWIPDTESMKPIKLQIFLLSNYRFPKATLE